jgi:hypothetical protein
VDGKHKKKIQGCKYTSGFWKTHGGLTAVKLSGYNVHIISVSNQRIIYKCLTGGRVLFHLLSQNDVNQAFYVVRKPSIRLDIVHTW